MEVNGRKYTAPHILIATGGQPSVLSNAEVPGKTEVQHGKEKSALCLPSMTEKFVFI